MEIIESFAFALSNVIIFLLSVGIFVSSVLKAARLEREAIENGLAYYHPKTGKFTWHSFSEDEE